MVPPEAREAPVSSQAEKGKLWLLWENREASLALDDSRSAGFNLGCRRWVIWPDDLGVPPLRVLNDTGMAGFTVFVGFLGSLGWRLRKILHYSDHRTRTVLVALACAPSSMR